MVQLYFEKITELTVSRSESQLFKTALVSLATDSGIHPLVPYFTFFVADEVNISVFQSKMSIVTDDNIKCKQWQVSRNLNSFPLLFALMRLVWSLLRNPHIHIEPYVSYFSLFWFSHLKIVFYFPSCMIYSCKQFIDNDIIK